jgi:hypothetical protein
MMWSQTLTIGPHDGEIDPPLAQISDLANRLIVRAIESTLEFGMADDDSEAETAARARTREAELALRFYIAGLERQANVPPEP